MKTDHHKALRLLEVEVELFCLGIWFDPTKGQLLVLTGRNGNGKTHAAKAVYKWCQSVARKKTSIQAGELHVTECVYHAWPELLDELKSGGWGIVDRLKDVDVLILDEIGGGHDPSMVGTDKLCQILSAREHKWTMLTTNIEPMHWESMFDKRIASRLLRNSRIIDMSDVPDFSTIG